jgi:hypothetical protein
MLAFDAASVIKRQRAHDRPSCRSIGGFRASRADDCQQLSASDGLVEREDSLMDRDRPTNFTLTLVFAR